jgi:hypothetical protein
MTKRLVMLAVSAPVLALGLAWGSFRLSKSRTHQLFAELVTRGETGTALEMISAAAVVASLVFVELDIQQNTAAQRSQTRQAISDASFDCLLRLSEDEGLMATWHSNLDHHSSRAFLRGQQHTPARTRVSPNTPPGSWCHAEAQDPQVE